MTRRSVFLELCLSLAVAAPASSQSFDSGSKGFDGALVLSTPGTIQFDPRTFVPTLNPSGDHVYHFTSIYIAKDVTVKLASRFLNGSVFWLSQGAVQIDGTIDLDGADGGSTPALAGAGGYPGGAARESGYHPEAFTPNVFLVPLVGGFGGDGGETQGGGGGGGALLITSSVSITINGTIKANGGASPDGTGGGGGAIRLVAPLIAGSGGSLSAKGGQPRGIDGGIRFETFETRFGGSLNATPFAQGKPLGLFLPPHPPPSVRLVSMNGIPLSAPDITINQATPIALLIEARRIPPGTVIDIECFSNAGSAATISTTPLVGTFDLSRAAASATFPTGPSHCQVKAAWKQPPRGGQPR